MMFEGRWHSPIFVIIFQDLVATFHVQHILGPSRDMALDESHVEESFKIASDLAGYFQPTVQCLASLYILNYSDPHRPSISCEWAELRKLVCGISESSG